MQLLQGLDSVEEKKLEMVPSSKNTGTSNESVSDTSHTSESNAEVKNVDACDSLTDQDKYPELSDKFDVPYDDNKITVRLSAMIMIEKWPFIMTMEVSNPHLTWLKYSGPILIHMAHL